MTDLANIVLLRAHVGKSALLGDALRELVALTRREPGCALCELHQSAVDPNTWMVYERWKGQEALASHMQQPYVGRFLEIMGDLAREPAEVLAFNHYN